jgi:AcrR family transcriptional regulator
MPKHVDHGARRYELSSIAAALIAEGGMEAATIREIAHRSGYSKGVVEHYFENKDELISGALDCINRRYEQRVDRAIRGHSGMVALRQRIAATLPVTPVIRNEWKVRLVFWSMAAVQGTLRERQAQRFERAIEYFAADIAYAMQTGEVSATLDARQRGYEVFTATIGIASLALYNPSYYNKAFLLAEIDRLIERLNHQLPEG